MQGSLVEGVPHGNGVIKYANGDAFVGVWVNGQVADGKRVYFDLSRAWSFHESDQLDIALSSSSDDRQQIVDGEALLAAVRKEMAPISDAGLAQKLCQVVESLKDEPLIILNKDMFGCLFFR